MTDLDLLARAAARLRRISNLKPKLAIVLGSGFHHILSDLKVDKKTSYSSIPGFSKTTVRGHAGELCFGHLSGTPVMLLSGRAHYYEGLTMEEVTFPIRALAAVGVTDLVLTNAAGGINGKFRAGDFMVLSDHINLMGANPLRGKLVPGFSQFVDLTNVYDDTMSGLLLKAGRSCKARLHCGVYLAVSGPSYETPAEIQAFGRLGADAVGMSTVPEAIVARQCGLRVAAISCISNLAAGISAGELSHEEVLEIAERVKSLAADMLKKFAALYGRCK